jgi:hypothetical protein
VVVCLVLVVCVAVIGGVYWYVTHGGRLIQTGGASQTIGPAGAEMAGPGGARLIVPQGALDQDAQFRIAEISSPPALPVEYLVSPVGQAFEVTAPEGTLLHDAAELLLPIAPPEGSNPDYFTVFQWDGQTWWDIGGFLEGDTLHTRILHFSIFQPAYGYFQRRPIAFTNNGPYHAVVRTWTFIPAGSDTPAPPPNISVASFGPTAPGLWPNPSRYMSLLLGTYTFCVDYQDDSDQFHYFFLDDPPLTVNENMPDSVGLAYEVRFSTDGIPMGEGRCPESPIVSQGGQVPGLGQAPGAGDVTIRLSWNTIDDLDLHVIDPSTGEDIYFGNQFSGSGGELDRDSNPACSSTSTSPVENVFWPTGQAPSGTYQVRVHYWGDCDGVGPVDFRLRVMSNGAVIYDGTASLAGEDDDWTYQFTR